GLYYWLGAAHETSGNTAEALAVYKKVQAEDLQYRDVEARINRLLAGGPAPRAAAPAPAPAPRAAAVAPPAARPPAAPPAPPPAAAPAARALRWEPKEEIGQGPLGHVLRA